MKKIRLAFLWHQHQPFYYNLWTGEFAKDFPWVRLHGVKDYHGMIALLEEFPKIRQTFNYVPSLLRQIELYLEGKQDYFQKLTLKNAAELTEDEQIFILDHFFMANWDRMIKPHPRYEELRSRRFSGLRTAREALPFFKERDWRDLQVWANLVWFHPTTVEKDQFIEGLMAKGHDFSETEKQTLMDKQLEILRDVIPRHKKLQDSGQIEVTTTPYYHPILPLLTKMESAHEGMPGAALPKKMYRAKEDAAEHVRRAVLMYEKHFGRKPRGMWPAEGSVSEDVVPLFANEGIEWIATDEEILERSIGEHLERDNYGHLKNPALLYQPYNLKTNGSEIKIIFRDHKLSDMIGFEYQHWSASSAADNFIHRIKKATDHMKNPLVSVILDGENAWESYFYQGVQFFRELYALLSEDPEIETVTVSDTLTRNPPKQELPKLFPGSWISHNFAVWIGHPEENLAWELLRTTRAHLVAETKSAAGVKEVLALSKKAESLGERGEKLLNAWEELFIAEGSDWFWWYGDDHFSGNDEAFDFLFREHLKNVYRLTDKEPPHELDIPIIASGQKLCYTNPIAFLNVNFDGRETSYFEWLDAGRYESTKDGGVMEKTTQHLIPEFYFGFSQNDFFLRIDFEHGVLERIRAKEKFDLNVVFSEPSGIRVVFPSFGRWLKEAGFTEKATADKKKHDTRQHPHVVITDATGQEKKAHCQMAFDKFIELGVRFDDIGLKQDEQCSFHIELTQDNTVIEKCPQNNSIRFTVPNEFFEHVMWQV